MMTCPKIGSRLQLHYNAKLAAGMPHSGKVGTVIARKTKGRPRSHLIQLDDGTVVIVPCGNLIRPR